MRDAARAYVDLLCWSMWKEKCPGSSPGHDTILSNAAELLRRDRHDHLAAFEPGVGFHLDQLVEFGAHLVENPEAQFLVHHLAATEAHGDLHLVALAEERPDRAHLHFIIMGVDAGAHLDLFDLDH